MGIAVRVDRNTDLLVETLRGQVGARALLEMLAVKRKLLEDKKHFGCLTDFRSCVFALSYAQIRRLAEESAKLHDGPVALVVDSDLNFGLARQFQAHRESFAGRGTVQVFRDIDDARRWIHDVLSDQSDNPSSSASASA